MDLADLVYLGVSASSFHLHLVRVENQRANLARDRRPNSSCSGARSRQSRDSSPLRLKEANEVGQALTRASRMLQDASYRANHDPLTQLPNRELFQDIAVAQLAACHREGSGLGILYVDLDDFKHVNDRYGHAVGDELLRAVATKLRNAVRRSDLVARLGGDEFAVLLFGVQPSGATAVANHLIEVLSRPFALRGTTLQVSASVGIAVYPNSGNSIAMLLSRAYAAMYKPKRRENAKPLSPRKYESCPLGLILTRSTWCTWHAMLSGEELTPAKRRCFRAAPRKLVTLSPRYGDGPSCPQ